MERLVINNDLLSKSKALIIGFENCDAYEIDAKEVLDIYCETTSIGGTKSYRTNDGFIKISSSASKTTESFAAHTDSTETAWNACLIDRLRWCRGAADITSFSVKGDGCGNVDVYVPYDPLENALTGGELELSNCPSFETDKDGNMLIYFGKSSKQPSRKDNDYSKLVRGWKDAFGDYSPKVLSVKAMELSSFGEEKTNLSFRFKILGGKFDKKIAELVFFDCKSTSMKMLFPQKCDCKIVMSKMIDDRIYVAFDGVGVDFTCKSIFEYEYYCNREEQ